MTYGVVINATAPIEMYDAVHRDVVAQLGSEVQGLLLHVARHTTDGFQVIEVWESKEQYERYNSEVVTPTIARLSEGRFAAPEQPSEEFEPRGLVIPRGDVVI